MSANQYNQASSTKVTVPDKLKCATCNKYKPQASYSKKEISDWKFRNAQSEKHKEKIRCRQCTGGPKMEMLCTNCNIVQSLDNFSKSQRGQAAARCKDCVSWYDVTEPGVLPIAAPETDIAPDEEFVETAGDAGLDDYDIEGDCDSDDDDEGLLCRKADLLSIADTAKTDTNASTHSNITSVGRFESLASRSNINSTSSPSNPYESSGSIPISYNAPTNPSWSSLTTVRNGRNYENTGLTYNAYDQHGQVHTRQQSIPSLSNGMSGGSTPVPAPKVEYTKNGWPKKRSQLGPKRQIPEYHLNRDQPKSKLQIGIIDDDDDESEDEM